MILHSPPPMGRRCPPRQPAKIRPLFPHPSLPCHTHPAPAAGWIANVSVQAGGRPSEAVVTCSRWREEAVHRHCSAGRCRVPPGRAPDQPPEKSLSLVPASAGRQPGRGWKRACGGPSCGYREGHGAHAPRPGAPASSTRGQARVGECHKPLRPPVSGQPTSGTPPPVGRGHRPARLGPARVLRHPVHAPRMHTRTNHLQRRQPARGPPDPIFLSRPRRSRARDCRRPPFRKPWPTQSLLTGHRTLSIARPAPSPVDFGQGNAGKCRMRRL
jgi:hypothetical protein